VRSMRPSATPKPCRTSSLHAFKPPWRSGDTESKGLRHRAWQPAGSARWIFSPPVKLTAGQAHQRSVSNRRRPRVTTTSVATTALSSNSASLSWPTLLLARVKRAARSAVIRTRQVTRKTTLLLFRCRNVIEQSKSGHRIVAEEMLLWGWRGAPQERETSRPPEAKALLTSARASSDLSPSGPR
jgi:hypothetical protein